MISSTAFVDIKCLPQALLLQSAVAVSLMLLEFFSLMISSPAPASLATPATSYTIIVDGMIMSRAMVLNDVSQLYCNWNYCDYHPIFL